MPPVGQHLAQPVGDLLKFLPRSVEVV